MPSILPALLLLAPLAADPRAPISLEVVDAPVVDVLRLLADAGDLNLVISDDVQGKVTLRLNEVAWEDAFAAVLACKGLAAVPVGELTVVSPLR